MRWGGWLLLLIFILLILVYVFLKSEREEGERGSFDKSSTSSYTELSPPPVMGTPEIEKKTMETITIYEYRPAQIPKLCRCCDGENSADARWCCICGEQMDI